MTRPPPSQSRSSVCSALATQVFFSAHFFLLLQVFCICCSCCLGTSLFLIPLVNSHLSFRTPFKVTNSLLAFQTKAPILSSNGSNFHSLVTQTIKNPPAMQETQVQSLGGVRSLGQEDPLEKGMATQSSILAWRIPWTEEPGGLQSMGSQRVRHD